MTVREFLLRVSSAELTELLAWYRLNPCGDEVVCAQIALAIAVFANANTKKGAKTLKVSDFYIVDKMKPNRRMTVDQMKNWAKGFVEMAGGKVIKRG